MIEKIPFGKTGHLSTRTLFGAASLGNVSQSDADRTLEVLLEYGVNHIDVAASYGDAELRIGPWMEKHRQDFFLATKTGERTYEKARDEIHRSLERLQVDSVDLIQLHNLIDLQEWEMAFGPGGALEAVVEARDQGLVRFIGVTGHTLAVPQMHLRSLERFDFDSVLLPYNYPLMQNPQYAADFEALERVCQERGVAVQTIKTLARRHWGENPHAHATWYEPFDTLQAIELAMHWALARPGIFLNTLGDIDLLPAVLQAASNYDAPPSQAEMQALVEEQSASPLWPEPQQA